MKKMYLLWTLFLFIVINTLAQDAPPFSVTRMAVSHENSYSLFSSYQRQIKFNDTTVGSGSYWDITPRLFIAKCDSEMNLLWYRDLDIPFWYAPLDVQLVSDSKGNTYLVYLLGRLALIKFDMSGNIVWQKISSSVPPPHSGVGVGVDSSDNVYLSGQFFPGISFGADTLTESLTYTGTFVAKFDSAGNEQWLTGLSGSKRNNDFCASRAGVTHIAGSASSLQGFGPITFTIPYGPVPSLSVCNPGGNPYWQANLTGTGNEHKSVGVGPNQRPVVTGKFYDTVGFSSLPRFSAGDSASFVASYNMNGTESWAKKVAGVDLTDVGVTSANDIFVLGEIIDDTVIVDTNLLSLNGAEGTVVRLDSNGNYICNFNFSNFNVESSSVGPGDEYHICGRVDLSGYYHFEPFWRPVFGNDTIFSASDACICIVTIGSNCELKSIDSLTNFYAPIEKVFDRSTTSKLLLYPNPVSNNLSVRIDAISVSAATLNIRDALGKVVRTLKVKSQDVDIDMTALSPGIYILEYLNGTDRIIEKFIKR